MSEPMKPMSPLEMVIKNVATKDDMHRRIDEMPDDVEAILLYHSREADETGFVRMNVPNWGALVYWLGWFQQAIYRGDFDHPDEDTV